MTTTFHPALATLLSGHAHLLAEDGTVDEETLDLADPSGFAVAFFAGAGAHTAAWVDEAGEVHVRTLRSAKAAAALASKSWGR